MNDTTICWIDDTQLIEAKKTPAGRCSWLGVPAQLSHEITLV